MKKSMAISRQTYGSAWWEGSQTRALQVHSQQVRQAGIPASLPASPRGGVGWGLGLLSLSAMGRAVAHLERLHKGPEKDSDGVTLTEEFDETGSSEEAEEAQVDEVILGKCRKKG